jgi:hypothetical protein
VGMSQRLSEQEITEFIEHAVKYNNDCNNVESECKLIKCWPTKKNRNVFQAVVQVHRSAYDQIMKAGGVFIGYDFCFAFDAHDILRCYNCNGFNHSSKFCNQKKSCPKCGVEDKLDHTISEC